MAFVVTEHGISISKGVGYVSFALKEDAKSCYTKVLEEGLSGAGRRIRVQWADKKVSSAVGLRWSFFFGFGAEKPMLYMIPRFESDNPAVAQNFWCLRYTSKFLEGVPYKYREVEIRFIKHYYIVDCIPCTWMSDSCVRQLSGSL